MLWHLTPFTINAFVSFGVFVMLTTYLVETFAISVGLASAVFAVVHVGGLVGVVVGGAISDRFGRVVTMLLLLSLTTGALAAIYLLSFGVPQVLLWALVSFTSSAYFPVTFAYLSDMTAPASPAPLVDLFTGVGALLGGISPTLIGAVGDAFGLRSGMLFTALSCAAGLVVLLALHKAAAGRAARPGHELRLASSKSTA